MLEMQELYGMCIHLDMAVLLNHSTLFIVPEPPAEPGYLRGYRMHRGSDSLSFLRGGSPEKLFSAVTETWPHPSLLCLKYIPDL